MIIFCFAIILKQSINLLLIKNKYKDLFTETCCYFFQHIIPQICLLVTTLAAVSNSFGRENNAIRHLIFKRYSNCNTGCSNSCSSCSSNSCSSSCNSCISNNCCQNCCQNQCQVCQTSNCYQQSSCRQCCQTHCTPEPCDNITTTIRTTTESKTTTESEVTTESVTIPPRPTPVKRVETHSHTLKESMALDTKNDIRNYISSNNNVNVPVNVTNINVLRMFSRSHHESRPMTTLTPHQPGLTPATDRPHTTTQPPNSQIIIIHQPIHSVQPVVNLPCYGGSSCHHTRPYWSGQICNSGGGYEHLRAWGGGYSDWSGYGGYGFGHGLNWGHLGGGGCRSVQQDCSYCGSDFYNHFGSDSDQFSSCYGCFV